MSEPMLDVLDVVTVRSEHLHCSACSHSIIPDWDGGGYSADVYLVQEAGTDHLHLAHLHCL